MEIKRVGENKIRCALTEDEIRKMGFDIDAVSYTHLDVYKRQV